LAQPEVKMPFDARKHSSYTCNIGIQRFHTSNFQKRLVAHNHLLGESTADVVLSPDFPHGWTFRQHFCTT